MRRLFGRNRRLEKVTWGGDLWVSLLAKYY
jgi:hypothetical protein